MAVRGAHVVGFALAMVDSVALIGSGLAAFVVPTLSNALAVA